MQRLKPIGVGLFLGIAVWAFFGCRPQQPEPGEEQSARLDPLLSNEAINEDYFALETRERHRDETVWAAELRALDHGGVFAELWDQLRGAGHSLSVLQSFRFQELLLGKFDETEQLEHQILRRRSGTSVKRLSHRDWSRLLRHLWEQGYRLEQSEWRHRLFTPATNDVPARSVIAVTLHVNNPEELKRVIVRGDLRVNWRPQDDSVARPAPSLIDATGLEMLSRSGEPPFEQVIAADETPEADARVLEPSLYLYDLNRDGLSEIVIPRRNRLFWNRGQGVFSPDRLCAHPLERLGAGVFADFDNDGWTDFLAAHTGGLVLFRGDSDGRFLEAGRNVWTPGEKPANPFVLTAGDIDADKDLDVWLAQYKVPYQGGQMPTPYYDANDGHPAYLLINDGAGTFKDQTERAGLSPKRFRRTYSSSFADLDRDRDLDLLVVSDFAGIDLYRNDGNGRFTDFTAHWVDEPHLFGMAHAFGDYDGDGSQDLLAIGMNSYAADRLDALGLSLPDFDEYESMRPVMAHGNRLYLHHGSKFRQTALSEQIARTGWSWGATSGDFDNDGDLDVYVVNGHISGKSARDYESHFWRHDLYVSDSKDDPVRDLYFRSVQTRSKGRGQSYGGYEKNRFFLNQDGRAFVEAGYLLGVAMEEDCRNVVCDDLDGDGKLDLLVMTFQTWPQIRHELHLFPNFMEDSGRWIGVRLREFGSGFSPIGAKVVLDTGTRRQERSFVTGDSYRSQHAATAHFGLGNETSVKSIEVFWPNGQQQTLEAPEVNRYHTVKPPGF